MRASDLPGPAFVRLPIMAGMADEVMLRSYTGETQQEAAVLYAEDAPNAAADGWMPISQVWLAGEWPTSYWIIATVLVFVGIGIVFLFLLAVFKPDRTLLVTYGRTNTSAATDR